MLPEEEFMAMYGAAIAGPGVSPAVMGEVAEQIPYMGRFVPTTEPQRIPISKLIEMGGVEVQLGAIPQPLVALAAAGVGWGIQELMGGGGAETQALITQAGGRAMDSGQYVNGATLVDHVPFGGPGVPEPPAAMVSKAWKTKAFSKTVGEYWVYFWRLTDGRVMCWNAAKRQAKIWRPKKPIVLYRGKVTLSQAVKTQRMLDRLWRTVAKKTKALKLA